MPFIVVATPWAGTGTRGNPYRPAVAAAFPLRGFRDVTATPMGALGIPAVNVFVVRAFVTDAVLAQIDAHPQWRDAVLSVTGQPDRDEGHLPDEPFKQRLKDALAARGLTPFDLAQSLGNTDSATRRELAARLIRWLRNRPGG